MQKTLNNFRLDRLPVDVHKPQLSPHQYFLLRYFEIHYYIKVFIKDSLVIKYYMQVFFEDIFMVPN